MRVSRCALAAVAGMVLFGRAAHAQSQRSTLETAQDLLKAGHADQSLGLVDPIITQAMADAAKDPHAVCPSAAAAVLQSVIGGKFIVSIANDWCDAMLVKGYALIELGRTAEAEDMLKILVGHAPHDANYVVEYAYVVRLNGEPERALGLYRQAERDAGQIANRATAAHWRAVALRGQGYALGEMQRWDEATKAYQRSLKYAPDNAIAQNELRYIAEHRPH